MRRIGRWRTWGLVVVCVYRHSVPRPAQVQITGIYSPADAARAVAEQQAINERK